MQFLRFVQKGKTKGKGKNNGNSSHAMFVKLVKFREVV
jgi:hypothetical protein